ncbi:MAG: ABC transporter permease subunit [Anaerolineales bacterium]|nr:ABC transporter permease subunit [Anaerolineales bacterium]
MTTGVMDKPERDEGERSQRKSPFKLSLGTRRMLWGYVFLFIPFAYLTIVRFIPTFLSLNMSFREWSILSPVKTWVGIDNFVRLVADERFWIALRNNFTIALIAVPLQVVFSLAIAILLHRIVRFRGIFRLIYFVPFMTVIPAIARVWRWAYAPQIGTFNTILQSLGLPTQPFLTSPDQALYSIIAVVIWQSIGFAVVIMLAGLNQIPRVYYEAAELDGANFWQRLRHVTIPLMNTAIVFLTITLTIGALQTFTLVFIMAEAGGHDLGGPLNSTRTLVIHIYDHGFKRYEFGYAAAITVVMLLLMIGLAIFQIRVLSRRVEY